MKIPYIKIKQRSEVFFLTKFNAIDLIDSINFHYREPYSDYEKDDIVIKNNKYIESITRKGIDLQSNEEGIQRRLQLERITSIKKYIESNNLNFLPNTVLLSADISKYPELENQVVESEKNEFGEFEFPNNFYFNIIDGQHRLGGLSQVTKELLAEFEIPAIILFNVSIQTAAKLFADINGKQKPVNKSLIYDLYSQIDQENYEEIKIYHTICELLYTSQKSPLYRQIKMLGIGSGSISQAFFIDYAKEAINKTKLKTESTQTISNYLFYYFKAYQSNFPNDWPVPINFKNNNEVDIYAEKTFKINKSQLVKTNGFGAILRAFPEILKIADYKYENFESIVKKQVGKISWTKDSETGTGKALQNNLVEQILNCYK